MNRPRALLTASLALNLMLLSAAGMFIHKRGGLAWCAAKLSGGRPVEYRDMRLAALDAPPAPPGRTVFLGDSLVDLAEWHELVPGALNRGISGDTTAGVLARLDSVLACRPSGVVLMVGVNDLRQKVPIETILANCTAIAGRLVAGGAQVQVVQVFAPNPIAVECLGLNRTTLPTPAAVAVLNSQLRCLPETEFLEVPELLNPSGCLALEYTKDGLHLNGRGAARVASAATASLPDRASVAPGR